MRTRTAMGAAAMPSSPPASAISKLSATSCRASRPLEAPSASLVAISRARVEARARKSPETFRQTRPNSTAVTANNIHSGSDSCRLSSECPCGAAVSVSDESRNFWRRSAVMTGNPGRPISSCSMALNHGCRRTPGVAAASAVRTGDAAGLRQLQEFDPRPSLKLAEGPVSPIPVFAYS